MKYKSEYKKIYNEYNSSALPEKLENNIRTALIGIINLLEEYDPREVDYYLTSIINGMVAETVLRNALQLWKGEKNVSDN